jgi:gliding motility-associated-like protein
LKFTINKHELKADFFHSELYPEINKPIYFRNKTQGNKLSYTWDFGDGNYANTENPEHSYKYPGTYKINLIVTDSICTDTITKTIIIEENTVKMPNIFTPNGDGQNDLFYLNPIELKNYEALIFDKSGKLIFKSNNPQNAWDGTLKTGDKAREGTYYFIIKGINKEGKNYQYKSFVRLSR